MKQKSLLKTMLLLFALIAGSSSVWAATTIYSWNGNGSTTTANETGGEATVKGGNSNIVVGASQKGNWCFKLNKGFSNSYYVEIALDEALTTGDKVTIGAFRSSNSTATLGVDFGTTATQQTKADPDYLESDGTPSDWEITVPAAANGSSTIRLYRSAGSTGIWVSKVVVTTTSTGTSATWTLDPTSATAVAGQSTTLQLTTNYDGSLNFTSNDESVATVSYNSSTKVITVNGIAAGSTSISVTGAATATYKAISKTIDVTVTRAKLTGELLYESVSSYSGSGDGGELTPSNAYLDYDGWYSFSKVYPGKVLSGDTDGNIKFGSKDYAGTAVTNSIALYGNATLTYKVQRYDSSNTGNLKITVTGATASGDVDVEGTASWVTKTVSITNGTGNVVITFETTSENKRIRVDDILLVQTTANATFGAGKTMISFSDANNALDFTDANRPAGLKAYKVSAADATSVTLDEVTTTVAENTGLILTGSASTTYDIPVVASGTDISATNKLVATDGTSTVSDAAVLKDGKFHPLNSGVIAAGKAYLPYANITGGNPFGTGAPALDIVFGGTTGIESVKSAEFMTNGEFYNLAGQRVAQPTKGLYIVNGKKVIIK